ncbi:hypothetical protein GWI33_006157 [Rhynchophorus ferrugineus]|uniref:Nicastrin n=1 Tax=Rhynchophorus ferrugineus TaxID=354439 RepID=A0A834IS34_RHYFE|nr:hypothetical protein GWI33_006157 [Rhynchophorus ferrugineus]
MLTVNCIVIVLFYLSLIIFKGNGDRIKDTMFEDIYSSLACYRRMNATHQIGCSSKRGGSTGVVHYCEQIEDLQFILKSGTAGPYIPVISTTLFKPSTVELLIKQNDKVSGLLVYNSKDFELKVDYFSHDKTCPNNEFNFHGSCKSWNPKGTGLLYADIPFPIFYVEHENDTMLIKECFTKFNNFSYPTQKDRSLCSLELDSFMYATTSTPTCKRRSNIVTNLNPIRLCDPLGDHNVWASLFPLVKGPEGQTEPIKDFDYIIIAARLDTTSLFDKTTGAESPVTGIVTLMSIAKLLKDMVGTWDENVKTNVLFILFNGETYDYIGSQRFLYDMERGKFPVDLPYDNTYLPIIYPNNVSLYIEISQLSKGARLYTHSLTETKKIANFISKLNSTSKTVPVVDIYDSLPPSSLHTFIRGKHAIEGIILANHEIEYVNHYYNSLYDIDENIEYKYQNNSDSYNNTLQQYIGDVATMVAQSVYEEIMNKKYTGSKTVDLSLINELFHCYLEDPNCKVHKAIQKAKLPKTPVSLYVGVDTVDTFISDLTSLTLAWLTGDVVGQSGPNCTNLNKDHVYKYFNMSSSMNDLDNMTCYRATVNRTEAVSPAFIIPDYDWSSNQYSSWSESSWHSLGVRMFLKPSAAHENTTIAIGSMMMVLSFTLVYFIKSRSNILFPPTILSDPPANC